MFANKVVWFVSVCNLIIFCPVTRADDRCAISSYFKKSPTFVIGDGFSMKKFKKINLLYNDLFDDDANHYTMDSSASNEGLFRDLRIESDPVTETSTDLDKNYIEFSTTMKPNIDSNYFENESKTSRIPLRYKSPTFYDPLNEFVVIRPKSYSKISKSKTPTKLKNVYKSISHYMPSDMEGFQYIVPVGSTSAPPTTDPPELMEDDSDPNYFEIVTDAPPKGVNSLFSESSKVRQKTLVSVIPYKTVQKVASPTARPTIFDYRRAYAKLREAFIERLSRAKVCKQVCFVSPDYYNYYLRGAPHKQSGWQGKVLTSSSQLTSPLDAVNNIISFPVYVRA